MRELDPSDLVRALNGGDARDSERSYGSRTVIDSIGGEDCWCGRPRDHDWLGKDEGAPHPRYPD
jgi:hypothetical protein